MPYKTIKQDFPEYEHEAHMLKHRIEHKHVDNKLKERLLGTKYPIEDGDSDIEVGAV